VAHRADQENVLVPSSIDMAGADHRHLVDRLEGDGAEVAHQIQIGAEFDVAGMVGQDHRGFR
jgi:hypothetical protein